MRIIYFNGQLGNQTFQYIFSRYLENFTGETVYLDDSYFFVNSIESMLEKFKGFVCFYRGYDLERVYSKIKKPALLSETFEPDVWDFMIKEAKNGRSVPQQLFNSGTDIYMVAETDNFSFKGKVFYTPTNQYNPTLVNTKGNVYYHGYWINKSWFDAIKDQIVAELELPPLESEKNIKYAEMMENTISVGVHVRRGDFMLYGWELPEGFYYNAIKQTIAKVPRATYFVFSDEVDWCRKNEDKLGFNLVKKNLVYIEGNHDRINNHADMHLMTLCKHFILANSSFSYLACLLSKRKDRIIINPTSRET